MTNPINEAKKLHNELKQMDKRLAKGEEIDKSEIDSLLTKLENASRALLLVKGDYFGVGRQISARVTNVTARARRELDDPSLFIIENGKVRRNLTGANP